MVALALLTLLLQLLTAPLQPLKLCATAPQLFPRCLELMLEVMAPALLAIKLLFQDRTALAQLVEITQSALAVLTGLCQGRLQPLELALMLLLLEAQGNLLLVMELLETGQISPTGLNNLLGLIETSRQFTFPALMIFNRLQLGTGCMVRRLTQGPQSLKQTRIANQWRVTTGISGVMA